jgi:hypothetical protein
MAFVRAQVKDGLLANGSRVYRAKCVHGLRARPHLQAASGLNLQSSMRARAATEAAAARPHLEAQAAQALTWRRRASDTATRRVGGYLGNSFLARSESAYRCATACTSASHSALDSLVNYIHSLTMSVETALPGPLRERVPLRHRLRARPHNDRRGLSPRDRRGFGGALAQQSAHRWAAPATLSWLRVRSPGQRVPDDLEGRD